MILEEAKENSWVALDFDGVVNDGKLKSLDPAIYKQFFNVLKRQRSEKISFSDSCEYFGYDPMNIINEYIVKVSPNEPFLFEYLLYVRNLGYKVSIASNNSVHLINSWLCCNNMIDCFDKIYAYEVDWYRKVNTVYFDKLCDFLGSDDVFFIDDFYGYVEVARDAGLVSKWYNGGCFLEL